MFLRIVAAGILGLLLRQVVNLQPSAWLAWLVPALMLLAVLRADGRGWRAYAFAACAVGYHANSTYYFTVMPVAAGIAIILAQSLLFLFILSETQRVIRSTRAVWTIAAYPVFWVALDTLMAAFLPDGNWASLAYTQSDFLPLMQSASLLGVPGVLFLLCLGSSAIALGLTSAWRSKAHLLTLGAVVAVESAAILFGVLRLREVQPAPTIPIAIAAVDDAIGLQATPVYIKSIQEAYEIHIAAASAKGARLVLLPEKIAVASESAAELWNAHFAASAQRHHVWLLAGLAVQTPQGISNQAWLYNPQGHRDVVYRKHFLAPPERAGYISGDSYSLHQIDGIPFGIAICKDMHFSTLGRQYGKRDAAVMLVPAWDFSLDAWMGARITAARAIENGYTILRSSRQGLLSATDPYGRIISETESGPLPGRLLTASIPARTRIPTLYTSTGDAFGWLCVALAGLLMWRSRSTRYTQEL
ncbi:MAG: nitrilase-related carbon-nitrogen hydrolase [Bryobacteraceae bacterium]